MALTDLTRISTSGIATGTSLSGAILHGDAHFRGTQVGVNSAIFDSSDDALELNDNVKLKFGNHGDIQIYNDGTKSVIKNGGSSLGVNNNSLHFYSQNDILTNTTYSQYFHCGATNESSVSPRQLALIRNEGVKAYYNNNLKFETVETGAVVTGILTATGFSGPTNNTSGIATFYDLKVTNNLTVEGTTSTLDTTLIGVDRVEVGANSNTVVGVAVTQSGTADIVNLFDGATKVVTVDDVGNVGLGSAIPTQKLDIIGNIKAGGDINFPTSMDSTESGGVAVQRFWSTGTITAGSAYKCGKWEEGEGALQLLINVRSETGGHSGTATYLWQGGYLPIGGTGYSRLFPLASGNGHGDGSDNGLNTGGWGVLVHQSGSYGFEIWVYVPSSKSNKALKVAITELNRGNNFTDLSASASMPSVNAGYKSSIKNTAIEKLYFKDNHYAYFGDSQDLQLWHNGSHSYIKDNGTGRLIIQSSQLCLQDTGGNNHIINNPGGSVQIYHDFANNSTPKIETTSSGINVTGVITASQFSSVNGSNSGYFKDNQLSFSPTGDAHIDHRTNNKDIFFRLSRSSALDTNMMQIDSSAETTKFHKQISVGLQGGADTAYLGGGSGIGAMLILNHATTGRNTFLAGNGDSYLNVNHGNLGIGTATPSGKVDISANGSQSMLMFKNNASNFARMGYNSAAGVSILDIRGEGHIRLLTGGNNERIRFPSGGGVGISTDKIRNSDFLHIATASQDYSNSSTELMDGGGICFQNTDHLASTNRTYPGIFWSGNTASLGRARAGILGVAAANNDATHLVFLTRHAANGTGFYPTDERMRIDNSGRVLIGSSTTPTSDSDKLQVISTSSGTGLCLHNYSASSYGNQIAFMKSRSNTIGTNTILNNGDRIGELNFYGNDGSGRSLGAQISVRISGTPGNDNTPAAMYFMNGANQSMQTRLSILPAGTVGISKNGWASSDNSFALTVHTGSTSDSGNPVNDGIMIVSQNSNGNQNSTTGKLMFCGHAQTNGPFLYGDNEQAYGKKGLVFHTLSTANSYSTQLEETARFTFGGYFGLGTGTAVDSLMHIQGNSDNGDAACQLTIEDEDDTAGSKIPSIQFKGNGVNTGRIRGTDTGGITFATWNGSSNIERSIIGNHAEGGAFLLNADDRGWATFRHNNNQGLRTHIRRHYSPGNAVQTHTILRIRRHWWGWGTYKITCKALYYNSSLESVYYVNGHGSGGNSYSIAKQTFGGDASNQDWNCTITHTASNNAPGTSSTWYADIQVNIPNYYYVTIVIEAFSSQYSTDPTSMSADSYCLM